MDFIPHVVEANYLDEYRIVVIFNDGAAKIVDLKSYTERGGVFEKLKDITYLKKFFIDLHTLCWPNGADIAPERLYEIGQPVPAIKN